MRTNNIMFLYRIIFITILLLSASFSTFGGTEQLHGSFGGQSTISVMTQNMDAGTDLKYLFAISEQFSVVQAATSTYGEVLKSDIPGRVETLAKIIARTQPDLISIQEVTLWQTVSSDGKTTVLYDQLQLLLNALKKLNHPYKVAIDQTLSNGQLPVDPTIISRPMDTTAVVSFTDSDAILVRADYKKFDFVLLNKEKHLYSTLLPFPLLNTDSKRGWLAIDAKIRGERLRFVNTHLETVNPLFPIETAFVQEAQASELVQKLKNIDSPVVIAGDFNADADFAQIGPDQTNTPKIMTDAGYTDTWEEKHPNNPGFTWPLFNEDPISPYPDGPNERIDLIYERGLNILNVHRIGHLKDHFPSDHLGVMTSLQADFQHGFSN